MDNYEFAKKFASIVHHGQKYGIHEYTYHLNQVEMVLHRFGFHDPELLVSAWLHDVIEDTGISYDKLKHGFGEKIADIVYSVTNEMGRNRKERFAKTCPKIKVNKDGIILKLADRIANIEFSKGSNTNYVKMYESEWPMFVSELKDNDESDKRIVRMWKYLESLFEKDVNHE